MQRVLAGTWLLVAGCFGEPPEDDCPPDETCSPITNGRLTFQSAAIPGAIAVPVPTLVGGTQDFTLADDGEPFTRPYEVDDTGGAAVAFDSSEGSTVHVRGVAKGSNYLRIVDPVSKELYGRMELEATEVSSINVFSPKSEWLDTSGPYVWAAGNQQIVVALYVGGRRAVDTSMQITADGAIRTAWDSLDYANLAPGSHTITITAGAEPTTTLEVVAVATADAIESSPPVTFFVGSKSSMCFYARSGQQTMTGVTWSFTTDNGTVESSGSGCPQFTPAAVGSMSVTATAAGATLHATYDVRGTP